VGSLIVQLAARAGARVLALAGDAAKLDLARRLGANVAIDYRADGWAEHLDAAAPDGLDVVFDGVGGDTGAVLSRRLRTGARYVVHGASSGRFGGVDDAIVADRNVTVVPLGAIGNSPQAMFDLVERALALAASGEIHPTVGQWFPLDRAADAHAAIEARRTIGKTLLIV
jgi:NADPH2:quinone reductase